MVVFINYGNKVFLVAGNDGERIDLLFQDHLLRLKHARVRCGQCALFTPTQALRNILSPPPSTLKDAFQLLQVIDHPPLATTSLDLGLPLLDAIHVFAWIDVIAAQFGDV